MMHRFKQFGRRISKIEEKIRPKEKVISTYVELMKYCVGRLEGEYRLSWEMQELVDNALHESVNNKRR